MVRALIQRDKNIPIAWDDVAEADFPAEPVTVRVSHSALNYKDALALTGRAPIFRRFPMVAGIDLAGVVAADASGTFSVGAPVLATGHGLGEAHWGGYSEQARLKLEWLMPIPSGMTPVDAMTLGTAGLTAMLSILALERHGVGKDDGPVLVTGATGGVGSLAVLLLAARGYRVVAATGRAQQESAYLHALGAAEILDRSELDAEPKPLAKERWAAAVDVLGGRALANVLAGLRYGGAVAASGLAQSMALPASVAPFILRGVSLLGIDSVAAPRQRREEAWTQLSRAAAGGALDRIRSLHAFSDVQTLASTLLDQKSHGRIVLQWA
ncbi:MAG TPA: MDR family oxidoreductase [Roseiarcus sp.]|jgi:acrylyl-CoA reductase (NADPH)